MRRVIIVISGLLLAGAFYMPLEGNWAPHHARDGYPVQGAFVQSPALFAVEVAPYAVGLAVVLMLALSFVPLLRLALGVLYALAWIVAVQWAQLTLAKALGVDYWLAIGSGLSLLALAALVVAIVKARWTVRTYFLERMLIIASLVQQAYSIVFCLTLDKMLLNYGAVAGVAGATGLLVALLTCPPPEIEELEEQAIQAEKEQETQAEEAAPG
jgi:hypothetical protein